MTLRSRHIEAVAWLLVIAIFIVSLFLAPSYSINSLYIVPILLGMWATGAASAYRIALLATVALGVHTSVATFITPWPAVLFNRVTTATSFWLSAFVVVRYREAFAGQQATARALERSIKDLEDVTHALDQAAIVATTNVRGDITSVNEKFCEISGYRREELMGANHRVLNSAHHPVEFFREMYQTIANGRVWRGEIRNRAKDGSIYWVDTTIVPFRDETGRPYRYIAIRYDITDRKQSEAALRDQASLTRLGQMAAVVAHEVRNPLAGIRGAIQIIGRRLNAGSREAGIAQEVVTRIDTLNDIVQDLLLFARPKPPSLAPMSLRAMIAETVSLLHADPKFVEIAFGIEVPDTPVMADREQLKLVLINLLINSAQAMKGIGRITIATERSGPVLELRIADQGPGIPLEIREHLFEPFFTTKHRGTGLGLATARRIIESHGGTIELQCPTHGGTTAVIHLPVVTDAVRA